MPRPAISPEKREHVRRDIKAAAVRLANRRAAEMGSTKAAIDVTVREVAKEASVGVGTFYAYFENIADLFQALWEEPVNALRQTMITDFEASDDPRQQVRLLLEHYVRFASENRAVFRGAFMYVRPETDRVPAPVNLQHEVLSKYLSIALENGQKTSVFKQFDTREMAQTLWAGTHGALVLPTHLDRYDFDEPNEIAARMIDTLLESIIV